MKTSMVFRLLRCPAAVILSTAIALAAKDSPSASLVLVSFFGAYTLMDMLSDVSRMMDGKP